MLDEVRTAEQSYCQTCLQRFETLTFLKEAYIVVLILRSSLTHALLDCLGCRAELGYAICTTRKFDRGSSHGSVRRRPCITKQGINIDPSVIRNMSIAFPELCQGIVRNHDKL